MMQANLNNDTNDNTAKIEAQIQRRLLQLSNGGVMHDCVYKKIRPTGSLRPRLYGLPKKHQKRCPSSTNSRYGWLITTRLAKIWQLLFIRFYSFTQTIAYKTHLLLLKRCKIFKCIQKKHFFAHSTFVVCSLLFL